MTVDTFANSIAHVAALLANTSGVPNVSMVAAGCAHVYDHEPGASGVLKPCSVTVSPAGMTPEFWLIRTRVYVTGDLDPKKGQALLIDVMNAVDDLMDAYCGPSNWESAYIDEIEMFVAGNDLMIGREDMN